MRRKMVSSKAKTLQSGGGVGGFKYKKILNLRSSIKLVNARIIADFGLVKTTYQLSHDQGVPHVSNLLPCNIFHVIPHSVNDL